MLNSIVIRASLSRVLAAIALAAGTTAAVACPPGESDSAGPGQQDHVLGQVQHGDELPFVMISQGDELSPHVVTLHANSLMHELPLLLAAMHGESFPNALGPDGQSMVVMTQTDGNDSYKVTIQDGKVAAEVNGKAVSEDRVRRKGDTVELLDKDGDVLATFQIPGVPQAAKSHIRSRSGTFTPLSRVAPAAAVGGSSAQAAEPPPVMLGITMSENPDEDTNGVTLASILPGLPAEKSGLKVADRVVEMDGRAIKNQKDLREVIRSKKAGDDLKIKVVRDGQEKDVTVHLEAFSAERMKDAGAPQWWDRLQQGQSLRDSKWDEAKQALERALEQVRNNPNLNTENMKEKSVAALEKALKYLDDNKAKWQADVRAWATDPSRGGMILGDRPQQLFVTPAPAAPSNTQNDAAVLRRMERIADSLERLDKRLDDLEKRLSEREQGSKPQR